MIAVRLKAEPSCWGVSYLPTEEGFPLRHILCFDNSLNEDLSYEVRMFSNVLASVIETPVVFKYPQVTSSPTIAVHLVGRGVSIAAQLLLVSKLDSHSCRS